MAYDLIKISGLPLVTPDNGQDIVVGVGDYAKRINYGDVKNDMVGTSPSYTTDTEPYLMRQTAHTGVVGKCALNKLVGGSLGWNQLAKELNSTNWINESGVTSSFSDGVATFSSTTSRNGIRSNANTIISGHKYFQSCEFKSATSIQVLFNVSAFTEKPSMTLSGDSAWHTLANICIASTTTTAAQFFIFGGGTYSNLQAQKPQIIDLTLDFGSTIADYIYQLETATAGAGVAKLKSWGIDLGTYHAYDAGSIQSVQATAHVTKDANNNVIGNYPLGSDTLRGIPQLVSNKLAFDGDVKTPDGTIRRKYGIANINDLTFTYDSTNKWLMGSSALPNAISSTTAMPNSMTDMPYDAVAANTLNVNTKAWTLYTGKVVVKDSSLTEAQLRAAISGKHIVYPLATPTTESSTAFQKVQTIDADGTESFTTSSPVPVGHETQTADNVLAALGWLGE